MSTPKRQRTMHITIQDKPSGWVMFASIRVERRRIVLHPTPAIIMPLDTTATAAAASDAPVARLEERACRLGRLLQQRWFGGAS